MLRWIWFVAFLVAALVVDRFVNVSPQNRHTFRVVVLVVAALWGLVLLGVLARLGIGI